MNSLKPNNPRDPNFASDISEWRNAQAFPQKLRNYVNDLNNKIILAGQPHSSQGLQNVTKEFVDQLNGILESAEFKEHMDLAKPKSADAEKIKTWEQAFTYTAKLKDFTIELQKTIDGQDGTISGAQYYEVLDHLIKNLESN